MRPWRAGRSSGRDLRGRLSDGTGRGQSLPGVTLTFALYDAEADGTRLWEQAFADVVVVDRAFSAVLGEGMSASGVALRVTDVFAEREAVGVAVAPPDRDGTEFAPLQPVGRVPYAARTEHAERVDVPRAMPAAPVDRVEIAAGGERGARQGREQSGRRGTYLSTSGPVSRWANGASTYARSKSMTAASG